MPLCLNEKAITWKNQTIGFQTSSNKRLIWRTKEGFRTSSSWKTIENTRHLTDCRQDILSKGYLPLRRRPNPWRDVQFAARQVEKENNHHFVIRTMEWVCALTTASVSTTPMPLSNRKYGKILWKNFRLTVMFPENIRNSLY